MSDRPLPDQYLGPDTDMRLAALDRVARTTGATRNQVVLAWLMAGTPSAIPLIAASSEAQLDENLGALGVELTDQQITTLNTGSADPWRTSDVHWADDRRLVGSLPHGVRAP